MKGRLLIFAGIVPTLMAITGCHENNGDKEKLPQLVKTEKVIKQADIVTTAYPGKVVADQDINLSFRIAGPIAKINVSEGDFVKKGTVIAEMDDRDYKLQLSATTAEYKQIKAEAERVIELAKRNSASQNDYDKAFYGLQQITAKFNAHSNALADTKLKAPFDGYIQTIIFGANETVGAGMPVISMIGNGLPQVQINLPSADFVKRNHFDKFYCTVNAFPGKIFPLRLINISKKANLNQLFTATFTFDSSGNVLPNPGMSANVFIDYKYGSNALVSIPTSAIFEKEGRSHVWVIGQDNTALLRQITPIDISRDGRTVVSAGIYEGERVVSAGVHSISEGEKVRIMQENSTTNIGNLL